MVPDNKSGRFKEALVRAVVEEAEAPPKPSFWARSFAPVRRRIVAGALFLIPVLVTIWLVQWFLTKIYMGLEKPLVRRILADRYGMDPTGAAYNAIGIALSVVVVLVFLYLVGLITTRSTVKRLVLLAEYLVGRIPFVKTCYKTTKQIVDAVSISSSGSLKKVVAIEYPRAGIWTLAFVTGQTRVEGRDEEVVNVYVPTTPNPTSGYMVMLAPEEVFETDMSIETAMRFIISAGILSPDEMGLRPFSSAEGEPAPKALNKSKKIEAGATHAPTS